MIVIEGADNVGKTTLIQQLLALDPTLFVMKRTRFNPRLGGTIGQSYLQMLLPLHHERTRLQFGIADRLLASECIYGALFRDGCRMSDSEHFLIKAALLSYGAIVIHCDAPDATIQATWNERPQLYERDPLVIAHAYRDQLASIFRPIEVIHYDYTTPDADRRRQWIVRHHQKILARYQQDVEDNTATCREETDE
jgi:hypothetical protein